MGKSVFSTITPVPSHIPRKLAIELLHNHKEMIELNPLVIDHHPIKAPKNAPADEFFAVWHEMTDRVQFVPGTGRTLSSKVSYKGVFHDMPWGLQTHIYAPMGLDIRDKWQIRGNEPGEPREVPELGVDVPHEGLYLREDVIMKCNFMMTGFVKKNLLESHQMLVSRLIKKAELIDAGLLRTMFGSYVTPPEASSRSQSLALSLASQSPHTPQRQFSNELNHPAYQPDDKRRYSQLPPYQDQSQGANHHNSDMAKYTQAHRTSLTSERHSPRPFATELPASLYHNARPPLPTQTSGGGLSDRNSMLSELSDSKAPNAHSRSNIGSSDRSSFTNELPGSTMSNVASAGQTMTVGAPAEHGKRFMPELAGNEIGANARLESQHSAQPSVSKYPSLG